MQFSQIFTAMALAMTATALPAGENVDMLAPRTGGSCHNNQHQECCNSVFKLPLLSDLFCAVGILGSGCGGDVYCCDAYDGSHAFISLNALNCVKIG